MDGHSGYLNIFRQNATCMLKPYLLMATILDGSQGHLTQF